MAKKRPKEIDIRIDMMQHDIDRMSKKINIQNDEIKELKGHNSILKLERNVAVVTAVVAIAFCLIITVVYVPKIPNEGIKIEQKQEMKIDGR